MPNQIQERTAQSENLNNFDAISIRIASPEHIQNGQKRQHATNDQWVQDR